MQAYQIILGIFSAIYFVAAILFPFSAPFPWGGEYTLNAIGDYLAGAISPLAFLWLIMGYFQNNFAIKNQINELKQLDETRQDALDFEKLTQARKDHHLRELSKPIFILSDEHDLPIRKTPNEGYLEPHHVYLIEVRFMNIGALVSHVRLQIEENPSCKHIVHKLVPSWPNDHSEAYSILCPVDINQKNFRAQLTIDYTTTLGERDFYYATLDYSALSNTMKMYPRIDRPGKP